MMNKTFGKIPPFIGLPLLVFYIANCFLTSNIQAQIRPTEEEASARARATFGSPPGFDLLSANGLVWVNPSRQMVICDGHIVLRQGQLEMFACPSGTKEHESVIATFAKSSWIHAALLSVGAKAGHPVKYEPFEPAEGSTIDVFVLWYDESGMKQIARAQEWVLHSDTKEPMKYDWVFGGSGFVKDPENREIYLGDYGELIAVANFPTATMDVSIESSSVNNSLLFEPNTEKIPPDFTPVRIVLSVADRKPRQ